MNGTKFSSVLDGLTTSVDHSSLVPGDMIVVRELNECRMVISVELDQRYATVTWLTLWSSRSARKPLWVHRYDLQGGVRRYLEFVILGRGKGET